MERRVLYVRPPMMEGNGVRAYSNRIIEAFCRYGDGRYVLVDASDCLTGDPVTPNRLALQLGSRLADLVKQESAALVFAEMGVGDFQVFHSLRGLKAVAPEIATLVTVHDPPRTVVNLNPIFNPYQDIVAVRAVRWLYNRTIGGSIERDFISQGHHWILLSEKGKQLWMKRLNVIRPDHPLLVMQHINYHDSLMEMPARLPNRPVRLGVLGSITKSKGIDILIAALGHLAQKGLLMDGLLVEIAGVPLFRQDHQYLEELKRQVNCLGLASNVHFAGYIPDDALPGFFERIDLLVLPYRETGSGSASGPLMWARSFGVPAIAARTRNLPEMIKDNVDGVLFFPGDVRELADCLHVFSQSPMLERLRAGARQRCVENSWPVCVAKLTALFDQITTAGNGIPT
ncbi:GDP-mannose-dependent alpha-(1-6)-phosphatidylinositol monomannoside mannosyltransferase [Geobacter sp. OR-1]|nr:GDP-mannose-dependent alpha-(1-6)-phosphatidylinositol monomannoside mannosyltransferase [Geobacter sp. OR-1]